MLYKLIRILLGAGILTALLFFLKKRRKWQIRTLAIFSALILFGVLCIWPFENLFFSFPTPKRLMPIDMKTPSNWFFPEKNPVLSSRKPQKRKPLTPF